MMVKTLYTKEQNVSIAADHIRMVPTKADPFATLISDAILTPMKLNMFLYIHFNIKLGIQSKKG